MVLTDPCITVLTDEGFVERADPSPDARHYLMLELSARDFNRYAEFDYFGGVGNLPRSETLWLSGMQKWNVKSVMLVMDDPKSKEIFAFFYFQNDPGFPVILGKLHEDSDLHRVAYDKFVSMDYNA
jgi:hypothetical protein